MGPEPNLRRSDIQSKGVLCVKNYAELSSVALGKKRCHETTKTTSTRAQYHPQSPLNGSRPPQSAPCTHARMRTLSRTISIEIAGPVRWLVHIGEVVETFTIGFNGLELRQHC